MSLPEDKRQEYLKALGIDNYFPRYRLPEAPKPVPCDWPESWIMPSPVSAELSISEKDDNVAIGINTEEIIPYVKKPQQRNTPKDILEKEQPVAVQGNETARPLEGKNKQEEIRLQLLCIRANDNLAIINAMPHFGPNHLSCQHMKLLQNLLLSANISIETLQAKEKPFHWPMVQGEHVDNGKTAAALALTAYLQQKLVDWQFSKLLIMGELVVSRAFAPDEKQEKTPPSLDEQTWKTFYTRSLDEILQSPTLKKEAWSVIKNLRS